MFAAIESLLWYHAQCNCGMIQLQSAPGSVALERQQFLQRCDRMDEHCAVAFDFSLEMMA